MCQISQKHSKSLDTIPQLKLLQQFPTEADADYPRSTILNQQPPTYNWYTDEPRLLNHRNNIKLTAALARPNISPQVQPSNRLYAREASSPNLSATKSVTYSQNHCQKWRYRSTSREPIGHRCRARKKEKEEATQTYRRHRPPFQIPHDPRNHWQDIYSGYRQCVRRDDQITHTPHIY